MEQRERCEGFELGEDLQIVKSVQYIPVFFDHFSSEMNMIEHSACLPACTQPSARSMEQRESCEGFELGKDLQIPKSVQYIPVFFRSFQHKELDRKELSVLERGEEIQNKKSTLIRSSLCTIT